MDREILFRGKRKDNGKWAFGDLLRETDIFDKLITRIYESKAKGTFIKFEVDPTTVCQYTGLTDKNGRKIFEGDIVKVVEDIEEIYVVEFDEDIARYIFTQNGSTMTDFADIYGNDCEVIGNIYDNPELVEG